MADGGSNLGSGANGGWWAATFGRALRSRNYRLFFMGHGTSLIGTWMQRVAMLWLVGNDLFPGDPKRAALWLGVVGFCGQIPAFFITPLAGVMADRINRRHAIILTQFLAMTQATTLAALTLSGLINIYWVIGLALFLGTTAAVDIPMRQSFVVEMVERPEDLNNAIALNSSVVNGGRLIGPSIGGVLTGLFGPGVCFLINAASYLAVISALLAMRMKPRPRQRTHKRILHNLREGFGYAYRFPPIRSILMLMTLVSVAGMPYNVLMPIFARDVLGGDSRTLGYLMAAIGVGALSAAAYLASRSTVRGLGRVISMAPAILGAGLIAFAISRSFYVSLLLMPLLGCGQMLLMASCNTVLQTIVDDDKRGRVMSFYSLSFMGMMPLGNLIGGTLGSQIGAPLTVAIGGTCCIAGSILFATRLPALRRLVHPIYVRKGIIPEVAAGLQAAAEMPAVPRETAAPAAADLNGAADPELVPADAGAGPVTAPGTGPSPRGPA